MGVEGFKGFLNRNPLFKKSFTKKIPEDVSSLFIDANGIFYAAASKVYLTAEKNGQFLYSESERKKLMKKSKKNLEKLHLKLITDELEKLINLIKPKDNLILAVDGVVNAAKAGQQKRRRFMKSFTNDPYQIFDTTSITPGTEFMVKLDSYLENWLTSYEGYLPENVIYSSHLSPGEGEHKIFDYIRKGKIEQGSGAHIINGLDNDLIILSVVSPLKNMYMRPENGTDLVNVENLRKDIIKLMNYEGADEDTLIRDFCVVATLLGNDFLHKFPNIFHEVKKTMPLILKIYKWNKKPLTDKNNNIIWQNYLFYLRNLDNYNRTVMPLYVQVYLNPPKYRYKELEDNIIVKNKDGEKVNQIYDPSRHKLDFNFKQFAIDWYKKQFNSNIVQWDGEVVETFTKKLISDMCINYLQTVQWVQYYYTRGYKSVDDLHFYHYIYNPLLGSVTTVLNALIKENKTKVLYDVKRKKNQMKITPIHTLLSVIPEKNINLLPKEYRELYKKYLRELNPSDFEILDENYSREHQRLPNLPQVNIPYIDKLLKQNSLKLPKDLKEKPDLKLIDQIEVDDGDLSVSHEDLI